MLQAQATLYYASYIGLYSDWSAANPSPIAKVSGTPDITTPQSNVSCQKLSTNDYYGTAVLVNGGPAQDSPIKGSVLVSCNSQQA